MSRSFRSVMLITAALGTVLGCYTVSLKVSAERAAVDKLRSAMVADARDIRMLQSELRTRARLPELQRWNDSVLALSAPTPQQFVRDGVQLASFAPGAPRAAQIVPAVQQTVVAAPSAPVQVAQTTTATPAQPAPRVVQPAPQIAPTRPLATGVRQIAYTVPSTPRAVIAPAGLTSVGLASAAPAKPAAVAAPKAPVTRNAPGLDASVVAAVEAAAASAPAPAKATLAIAPASTAQ